jgi:hypothetical protein
MITQDVMKSSRSKTGARYLDNIWLVAQKEIGASVSCSVDNICRDTAGCLCSIIHILSNI